jgi:hypothetical protein
MQDNRFTSQRPGRSEYHREVQEITQCKDHVTAHGWLCGYQPAGETGYDKSQGDIVTSQCRSVVESEILRQVTDSTHDRISLPD